MTFTTSDGRVEIYSIGPLSCSVCAVNTLSHEQVCEIVNQIEPVNGDWHPSKDEYFHKRSGEEEYKVGCVCEHDPSRRHWLMEC